MFKEKTVKEENMDTFLSYRNIYDGMKRSDWSRVM